MHGMHTRARQTREDEQLTRRTRPLHVRVHVRCPMPFDTETTALCCLSHAACCMPLYTQVADPATLPQEPSRFCLVANEEGVRQGQEITISYGSHADTVFFLLFGFLPKVRTYTHTHTHTHTHMRQAGVVRQAYSHAQTSACMKTCMPRHNVPSFFAHACS